MIIGFGGCEESSGSHSPIRVSTLFKLLCSPTYSTLIRPDHLRDTACGYIPDMHHRHCPRATVLFRPKRGYVCGERSVPRAQFPPSNLTRKCTRRLHYSFTSWLRCCNARYSVVWRERGLFVGFNRFFICSMHDYSVYHPASRRTLIRRRLGCYRADHPSLSSLQYRPLCLLTLSPPANWRPSSIMFSCLSGFPRRTPVMH